MIRNLFSGLLGHQWSDCGRRKLLEESRWLFVCPFDEITQEGLYIHPVFCVNDCAPIRIDEKAQAVIRILKHNEDDRRRYISDSLHAVG